MNPPQGITRSIGGWKPGPTERRLDVLGKGTATKAAEGGSSDEASPVGSRRGVDRHSTHSEVWSRLERRTQGSRQLGSVEHGPLRGTRGVRSANHQYYRHVEGRRCPRTGDTHLHRASGRLLPFTPVDGSTAATGTWPLDPVDSNEANVGETTTPFDRVTRATEWCKPQASEDVSRTIEHRTTVNNE